MTISDTQTGLRAFPTHDIKTLIEVSGDRFEYETNMLLAMKEYNIPFDEVKIRTVYIEENKSSHFHAVRDSWRIYKLILSHFFRYTISSILSAILDEALFLLLSFLLHVGGLSGLLLTAISTAGARASSSLFNFFINHKMVFHSHESIKKALARYYTLAIPQMLIQFLLTQGLCQIFHVADNQTGLRGLIYAAVMLILFILSYVIQKRWVFATKHNNQNED